MGLRLIPREEAFFDMFNAQATNMVEGARLLKDFLEDYTNLDQKRIMIEKAEDHGDEITHKIIEKLNTTFITPIDREDIHALASALDDILDYVNACAQRLHLYGIKDIPEDAKALANIILRAAEETQALTINMRDLKDVKTMKARWIEVNRLENEATRSAEMLSPLFSAMRATR